MKLIIPREIEERIHGYAMSVDSEIAGMGRVRVDGDDILVEEVMIYDQEVTGATADLSTKSLAKWQSKLVKAGGSPKDWRLWWHSHDNMPAFFSGRDTATIDAQTEGDWMLSLVVNKRREREARLDLYRPFRMYMDKLDIEIQGAEAYQVPADIAREVAEKVKRPVPVKYTGMGYGKPKGGYRMYEGYPDYGVPESAEPSYTREQLIAITKTLEGQIAEYENRGQGDSGECLELSSELVEMYYELAEVETSATVAESIRAEAELLENSIYNITPIKI